MQMKDLVSSCRGGGEGTPGPGTVTASHGKRHTSATAMALGGARGPGCPRRTEDLGRWQSTGSPGPRAPRTGPAGAAGQARRSGSGVPAARGASRPERRAALAMPTATAVTGAAVRPGRAPRQVHSALCAANAGFTGRETGDEAGEGTWTQFRATGTCRLPSPPARPAASCSAPRTQRQPPRHPSRHELGQSCHHRGGSSASALGRSREHRNARRRSAFWLSEVMKVTSLPLAPRGP